MGGSNCSPNVDAGRLCNQLEIRSDSGPGFGLHWRVVLDGLGADFSAGRQERRSDLLCLVALPGGLLQASTSVSSSPGSHVGDLVGCPICSPAHETDPVVLQGSVVKSSRTEPSGVRECRFGLGPSVVNGGVEFAEGDTLYASSTHCHCDHGCQYGRLGWPWPGVGITFRPLSQALGPGDIAPHQCVGAPSSLVDALQSEGGFAGLGDPDGVRQHYDCGLYQQGEGCSLSGFEP